MGTLLVVIIMAISGVAAAAIYKLARSWRLPWFLNLPGAWFAFCVIPNFSGWLLHDLLEDYARVPAPDVPWYMWLDYLGLTLIWYYCSLWLMRIIAEAKRREDNVVNQDK